MKGEILVSEFKKSLKLNGQTMKWFYDKYVREKTGLSYGGFAAQLNGYAKLSIDIETELTLYVNNLS